MEQIQVEGRGWVAPVCEWFADENEVRLRLDDDKKPVLWLTVTIPLDVLRAMVHTIEQNQAKEKGGAA